MVELFGGCGDFGIDYIFGQLCDCFSCFFKRMEIPSVFFGGGNSSSFLFFAQSLLLSTDHMHTNYFCGIGYSGGIIKKKRRMDIKMEDVLFEIQLEIMEC